MSSANTQAVLAAEDAPPGPQPIPMPKFSRDNKAPRQVAGIRFAPLSPAHPDPTWGVMSTQSQEPKKVTEFAGIRLAPLSPAHPDPTWGLVSTQLQELKKVTEFAGVDPLKPMKIMPYFSDGSVKRFSAIRSPQASPYFEETWEFWDGDTVAGETSSDDDSVASVSMASTDLLADRLADASSAGHHGAGTLQSVILHI